jgi:succinate dehydrogenase/fumarate reductase flavoprotein subunit
MAKRIGVDVIVVGGGGSGLAAAIEAARMGREVAVFEKSAEIGGSTGRWSIGSITACNTPLQKAEGIKDSPQEFFEDIPLFAGDLATRDNAELRRLLPEQASDTFSWLESLGIVFFGPYPEPPHRHRRMHNVLPNSKSYAYNLGRRARKEGVRIYTNTSAQCLLREKGRVSGVEVRTSNGEKHSFVAQYGVVLAAGDYSSGREMKESYIGSVAANVEGVNPYNTGDGQRLALEAGAEIVNGNVALGPQIRFEAPPRRMLIQAVPLMRPLARAMRLATRFAPDWLFRRMVMKFLTTNLAPEPEFREQGGIIVNKRGERFVNEADEPELAIPDQPDRSAFFVYDARTVEKFSQWPHFVSTAPGIAYAYLPDYHGNRKDIHYQADSIQELARKMDVPEKNLADTVTAYNESVAKGQDSAYGRTSLVQAIKEPPFHALGPAKTRIITSEGGASVTTSMKVADSEGRAIPGLFAAGATGQGGLLIEGHGLHVCWAFTSGRIAGRNAALAQIETPSHQEAAGQQS